MKNIVACVDFSKTTPAVVELATALASSLGAKLYLLNVVITQPGVSFEPVPLLGETLRETIRHNRDTLDELREPLIKQGLDVAVALVEEPVNSVQAIIQECKRIGAWMIVIGAHGHGTLHRMLMGSTAEGVLHKASCPVVIVPSRPLVEDRVNKSSGKTVSHTV